MSTYMYHNLGQKPMADLTAKRLLKKGAKLSKKLNKKEDISQSDVDNLEKFADRILKKYNIDIEFTRHFVDRLNDPRNSPEIKIAELQRFFKKIQRNKGTNIRNNPDVEAVLKDMSTNLNLPVVIKTKGSGFEVTNKTIMRKKDFKTTSKIIRYEDYKKEKGKFDEKFTNWNIFNEFNITSCFSWYAGVGLGSNRRV